MGDPGLTAESFHDFAISSGSGVLQQHADALLDLGVTSRSLLRDNIEEQLVKSGFDPIPAADIVDTFREKFKKGNVAIFWDGESVQLNSSTHTTTLHAISAVRDRLSVFGPIRIFSLYMPQGVVDERHEVALIDAGAQIITVPKIRKRGDFVAYADKPIIVDALFFAYQTKDPVVVIVSQDSNFAPLLSKLQMIPGARSIMVTTDNTLGRVYGAASVNLSWPSSFLPFFMVKPNEQQQRALLMAASGGDNNNNSTNRNTSTRRRSRSGGRRGGGGYYKNRNNNRSPSKQQQQQQQSSEKPPLAMPSPNSKNNSRKTTPQKSTTNNKNKNSNDEKIMNEIVLVGDDSPTTASPLKKDQTLGTTDQFAASSPAIDISSPKGGTTTKIQNSTSRSNKNNNKNNNNNTKSTSPVKNDDNNIDENPRSPAQILASAPSLSDLIEQEANDRYVRLAVNHPAWSNPKTDVNPLAKLGIPFVPLVTRYDHNSPMQSRNTSSHFVFVKNSKGNKNSSSNDDDEEDEEEEEEEEQPEATDIQKLLAILTDLHSITGSGEISRAQVAVEIRHSVGNIDFNALLRRAAALGLIETGGSGALAWVAKAHPSFAETIRSDFSHRKPNVVEISPTLQPVLPPGTSTTQQQQQQPQDDLKKFSLDGAGNDNKKEHPIAKVWPPTSQISPSPDNNTNNDASSPSPRKTGDNTAAAAGGSMPTTPSKRRQQQQSIFHSASPLPGNQECWMSFRLNKEFNASRAVLNFPSSMLPKGLEIRDVEDYRDPKKFQIRAFGPFSDNESAIEFQKKYFSKLPMRPRYYPEAPVARK